MAEPKMEKYFLLILLFGFLTEIVYGQEYENIAANKRAYHSTPSSNGTAYRGNDRRINSCISLAEDESWYVDLGQEHIVARVNLSAGDDFLTTLEIYVGKDPYKDRTPCKYLHSRKNQEDFPCFSPTTGRYVTITNPHIAVAKICDVRVLECNDGFYGSTCASACHCLNKVPCAKDTGICPDGCEAGFQGQQCSKECSDLTFGLKCMYSCHCKFGESCDKATGQCSSGCDSEWLGNSCQTEKPNLKNAPEVVNGKLTSSSITLQWEPWEGSIEPSHKIFYRLQYKTFHGRDLKWQSGVQVYHIGSDQKQTGRIDGLPFNTRFIFRIVPYVQGSKNYKGISSPNSPPIRTKCKEPDAPMITDLDSSLDESFNPPSARITVKWKPPTSIYCDSILYYIIEYRRLDSEDWAHVLASSKVQEKNLSGLAFNTEYLVRTIVVNNRENKGASELHTIVTVENNVNAMLIKPGSSAEIGVIAGVLIGIVVVIACIIAIALVRRRKAKYDTVCTKPDPEDNLVHLNSINKNDVGKGSSPSGDDSGVGEGSSDVTPSSVADNLEPVLPVLRPKASPTKLEPTPHFPIKVEELEDYVMQRNDNDREDLRKEYMEIAEGFTTIHDHGKLLENKHKNRFVNIIAYDHSRVILDKVEGDPDSDYINASYIDGYYNPKAYVAAQGCTKYTIQDMWRMVWQLGSHRIVMVTNLVENGKRKCEQYWSDVENEEKLYGDCGVTLIDLEQTSEFVIRTFNIRKEEEIRNVKQFHFTAWPDHGVPTRASPILAFRRKVRSYDESHPGTMIIHCSAGVGRTGTFIALDYLQEMAKTENIVDVYNLTLRMRNDRVNMIQTVEQYLFVYDALLEALKTGNTGIPCSDFTKQYEEMCKVNSETGKSVLQEQFDKLQLLSPKVRPEDCKSGLLAENQDKNRCQSILPADRHRPYLMTRVQGTNDYINAVFLDSYRSKNTYILTQIPLQHTVIDLWRTVYEHNCGSIVMLSPWDSNDETYGQYWPDDETCECGPFVIEPVSEEIPNEHILVRRLKLTYQPQSPSLKIGKKEEKVRTVNQFLYKSWPREESLPNNKNSLIALIDLVERSQLKTGNGPILIHCHDGVQQSGLYAAVSCIWEKMKVEHEVDIFQTIKQLRYHRPQMIQNIEQYQFCFEMVGAYLAEFDTYANFR